MRKFQRRPLAAAIALAVSMQHGALAQTRPEPTLPDVNVQGDKESGLKTESTRTATRIDTPLRDIAQSIDIVPQELIRSQNITTLSDALRNVTGITLTAPEGGTQNQTNFWLRGFPAGGDIFLDTLRDVGEYNRDLFNIESVEVLKGPASLLFGRGSAGGVINQTSKLPSLRRQTEVAATFGSYEQRRVTVDSNVVVGDRAALRVNAMLEDSGSYRDVVETHKGGIAPTLRLGIGTGTDIVLAYYYLKDHTVTDYGQPTLGLPFNFAMPPVSVHNYYGFGRYDYTHLETQFATFVVEHRFSEALSISNRLRWGNYKRNMEATISQLLTDGAGKPVTADTPLDQMIAVRNHSKSRDNDDTVLINQTELAWRVTTGAVKHTVLGGMELADEKLDRWNYTWTNAILGTSYVDPDTQSLLSYTKTPLTQTDTEGKTLAFYVQDQLELTQQLKAILGVRWERYKASYDTVSSLTGLPSGTPPSAARTDNMTSGRAGLIWQPSERQSYYLSWGNSYNPSGELGAYGATGTNLTAANLYIDPEKNQIYEVGAQWDVLSGLQIRGAIFRNEKTNGRVTDPALGTSVQIGKRRVDGVELEATGLIGRNLQIYSGIAYMDGKVLGGGSLNPDGTTTLSGKEMTIPKWSGNVWTIYDFGHGWQAGGGFQATSWRWADELNRGKIPGYALVNAMVAYIQPQWDVQLNFNNILDKKYYVAGYQNNPTFVIPGAPYMMSLSGRYRF